MGKGKKFEKFVKAKIAEIDFWALYKNKKERDASPERPAPAAAPKKVKVKKERDPNAPKKGAGPYFKFANAQPTKDRVRKVLGEKPKNADVQALKKQMWDEMSAADKEPYIQQAKIESDRFARQMAEYKATGKFTKEDPPAAPAPAPSAPAKKPKKSMFSSSSSSSDSSSI